MADYGGQDIDGARATRPTRCATSREAGDERRRRRRIASRSSDAMKLVVEDAKNDPSHLVPALPPSTKATIEPVFGRPQAARVRPVRLGGGTAPTRLGRRLGAAGVRPGGLPPAAGSSAPTGDVRQCWAPAESAMRRLDRANAVYWLLLPADRDRARALAVDAGRVAHPGGERCGRF